MAGGVGGFGGDGCAGNIRHRHRGGEDIITGGEVGHTGTLFDHDAIGIGDLHGHPGKLKIVARHHDDRVARVAKVTRCSGNDKIVGA